MPPPFSPEQLQRIIERLTAVLEEECGDDLAGWGASCLILLTIIIDMSNADRQEIADHILQPNRYREYLQ